MRYNRPRLCQTFAMPWRLKYAFVLCLCLVLSSYVLTYWLVLRDKLSDANSHPAPFILASGDLVNVSSSKVEFDPANGDVLVFFHIQKTGGTTFNSHLVNLDVNPACDCSTYPPEEGACRCRNAAGYTWFFSRFTTSSSCGVHPPLQDLRACVPKFLSAADGYTDGEKHRFLYITTLRDPIRRYLSEWRHLQNVAPWPSNCGSAGNTMESCLKGLKQQPMTLQDFLRCPGNPANNRQVRMLSLNSAHQCQDSHDVMDEAAVLQKAKKELENLAYFGLTDDQVESQELFEWTFNLKFKANFNQMNATEADRVLKRGVSDELLRQIRDKNKLDIELYTFALQLFYHRYETANIASVR